MISSTAQRRDGFDQWIHQINQICGAFNAQTLGADFSGRIREYQSGALKLSFVDACQARLYRTPTEIAAGEGGKYFAVFQLEGSAGMAQGDNKALLSAGDITLIDASRPSDFTYHENSRQLSLILPTHLVEKTLRFNQVKCGHRIPASSPMAMLSHHLILDATRQKNLSLSESEATLEAIVSLLRPAISHSEDCSDLHERIFQKTLACIDEHIRCEELCPEWLAREVGMSVRGLYRIFAKRVWWWRATSRIGGWICVPNRCVNPGLSRSSRCSVIPGAFPIRAIFPRRSNRVSALRRGSTAGSTPEAQ